MATKKPSTPKAPRINNRNPEKVSPRTPMPKKVAPQRRCVFRCRPIRDTEDEEAAEGEYHQECQVKEVFGCYFFG